MRAFVFGLLTMAVLVAIAVVIYQGAQVSTVDESAGTAVHVESPGGKK